MAVGVPLAGNRVASGRWVISTRIFPVEETGPIETDDLRGALAPIVAREETPGARVFDR